jgi:hypothetical protein
VPSGGIGGVAGLGVDFPNQQKVSNGSDSRFAAGSSARVIELALAGGGVDIPLAAVKKFMVVTALG